jgi:hypothetical protein
VYQDEDGMWIIRGRLAPEVGAVLVQALDAGREALYRQRRALNVDSTREAGFFPQDVSEETPSMEHQRADALALVAETALHHGIDPGAPGERYQVVVHVDAPVLADPDQPGQSVLDDGTHVSAETARRLACDASRVAMQHARDGRVVEVAARTRTIPPALGVRSNIETTAVDSRAVACASARVITFGIGHTEGRRRSPISLCSVAGITVRCTREGYQVERQPDGELQFRRPDGRLLPAAPPSPKVGEDVVNQLRARHAAQGLHLDGRTAMPGWSGERLNVGYAIDVLHPRATG